MKKIYDELVKIVGTDFVSDQPEERYIYSMDPGTMPAREPDFVVLPESTEEVRQIMMLINLGFVAYQEGDYQRARYLFGSYSRQMHEIGARQGTITGLAGLAGSFAKLSKREKAARLLGASEHHGGSHVNGTVEERQG